MWRLSTDLMLVAKFDSSITAVNPAWTTLLGWSETDLVGRSFMELIHPDDVFSDPAGSPGVCRRVLQSCTSKIAIGTGTGAIVGWTWTAVPDDIFIHAVGRDITDDKEKAEALARTEEALRQSQKNGSGRTADRRHRARLQ